MNPKTNETIPKYQYQIWGDLESWPNYVRNSNVTYDKNSMCGGFKNNVHHIQDFLQGSSNSNDISSHWEVITCKLKPSKASIPSTTNCGEGRLFIGKSQPTFWGKKRTSNYSESYQIFHAARVSRNHFRLSSFCRVTSSIGKFLGTHDI